MKRLNIAVCGLMFAAATAMLVSCQDIVTYNDGYDDGMTSNGVPSVSYTHLDVYKRQIHRRTSGNSTKIWQTVGLGRIRLSKGRVPV